MDRLWHRRLLGPDRGPDFHQPPGGRRGQHPYLHRARGAVLGPTFAPFRFNLGWNLSFTGQAGDGEVEDYRVMIEQESLDFGDAPQVYATLLANNGARHVIVQGLRLGQLIDAEADGQPGAGADQDDLLPAGGLDDEDGVTFVSGLVPGGTAQL